MLLEKYVAEDSTNADYMDLANMCISARQPELASAYMAKGSPSGTGQLLDSTRQCLAAGPDEGDIKAAISGYQAIADKYPQKTDDLQTLAAL